MVRRVMIPAMVALGYVVAGGASAGAEGQQVSQSSEAQRIRTEIREAQRIVIPKEVAAEIQRLVDTAIGHDLAQEISREVSRHILAVSRDVTRDIARAHEFSAGAIQNKDFKFEQTDRATKTLAIGAAGELMLKNVVGDITVKAGGSREATVEIVRVSRGRTDADAKLGLERVTAEVSVRGERGSVITQYSNDRRPDYSVSVAYTVTTPAGTRLTVDTITGHVRVSGLQGELSIGGVSGAVEVTACSRVATVKTIAANMTLTDVQSATRLDVSGISSTIRLVNIKAPRLTANVVSGAISARDIQAEGAALGSMSGDIEYSGSLSPKGRYEFQAQSGNVRLGITGGFDLEMRTFSGRVEADPSVNLTPSAQQVGTRSSRSVRGVAGSGGAAVVATTFSGNVWVGSKLK